MMRRLLFTALIILTFYYSNGQCPNTSFVSPGNGCVGQVLSIDNVTTNGDSYFWTLCDDNLQNISSSLTLNNGGNTFRASYSLDNFLYSNDIYGFVIRNNGLAYRFKNDFLNEDITDVIDLMASSVSLPRDFQIIEKQNEYFGLITNSGNTNPTLVNFGSNLLNDTPTFSPVTLSSSIFNTNGLEFFETQSGVYALLGSDNTNEIYMLEFQGDLTLEPLVRTFSITNALSIQGISLIKECGIWKGLLTSRDNSKIFRIVFDSGLDNAPLITEIAVADADFVNPAKVKVVMENGFYYGFAQMDQGKIFRFNFGNSLDNSPTFDAIDALSPNCYGLEILETNQGWRLLSVDYINSTKGLFGLAFDSPCNGATQVSTDFEPSNLILSESGIKNLRLTSTSASGEVYAESQEITVSSVIAPSINFTTQNICAGSPINFNSTSDAGTLPTYNWDFGDTNTASIEDPSHTYTSAGEYEVTLDVSDGTCDNFTRQTITVYDPPTSTFDSPPSTICTNQQVTFTNTVLGDFGGNETYEWQVDGNPVSTDRDLVYEFPSGGVYEIKLITSIPGCSDEVSQMVTVEPGPAPNFTVSDACQGASFSFTNASMGSNIDSYSWDFGNGVASTLEDPQPVEYTSADTYNVTLTTTNTLGCETSTTKPLTVYDLPSVNFSNELACEGTATLFSDQSVVNNANIENWEWSFGDGSSTSMDQNPTHIFSQSGSYTVKLKTTSTFGCIDSTTNVVNVLEAPEASFTFDGLCIGEEVQFTDQSNPVSGESITNWAWNLGGEFSNQQNPTTSFDFAIDYNVNLTVTSENLCSNTTTQIVSVPNAPDLDFGINNNCSNQTIQLYDLTSGASIANRSWTFEGNDLTQDSVVEVAVGQADDYTVSLTVITMEGCEYSLQRDITINQSPQAQVLASTQFGSPPLTVHFQNNSQSFISSFWDFKDGATSTETNPVHTFDQEGSYDVDLVITDENGCEDIESINISVVQPNFDVRLNQLNLVNGQFILTLQNAGTIAVDSLQANINLGDQITLQENIMIALPPSVDGSTTNYMLNSTVALNNLDFICIELLPYNNIIDQNPVDNQKCITFESSLIISEPYPNPTEDILNLKLVASDAGALEINILNSFGQNIYQSPESYIEGENTFPIDLSQIRSGTYLVVVNTSEGQVLKRIMIR